MLAKIRIIFILLILAVGGLFWAFRSPSPGGFIPYSYHFKSFEPVGAEEAAQSDVLIVGDRMGRRLDFYTHLLKEQGGWNVYNWSETGEGLHRTLNKMRHLSRIPPVVIYHGGADEFYEKKFDPVRDYKGIRQNLLTYQKNKKSIWARQFPRLAAFFLYPFSFDIPLDDKPLFNADKYEAFDKQRQMELTYHFFKLEFGELLSFFNKGRSAFIVVPPPLNLERKPGEVCTNTSIRLIRSRQKQLEAFLAQGAGAGMVAMAERLVRDSPGNAHSLHLRGRTYKAVGKLQEAKASFYRAGAFDCDTLKGSIIFNKIMILMAEKRNLTVVDFNSMVNNDFGKEGLFVENLFPEKSYYQQLMSVLGREVTKALKAL